LKASPRSNPGGELASVALRTGLIERLVLALTNLSGIVFDPFAGAGTTGVVAKKHQHKFLGNSSRDIAELQ